MTLFSYGHCHESVITPARRMMLGLANLFSRTCIKLFFGDIFYKIKKEEEFLLKKKIVFLLAATLLFACNETVPVKGVALNRTALSLSLGESATLKATVSPKDAAVQTVQWGATPTGIVTLADKKDGACALTAKQVGTATVTVTAADGGFKATCAVEVKPIAVTRVSLNETALSVTASERPPLIATVEPANAANKALRWSMEESAANIVEFTSNDDSSYTVIPKDNGTVIVTVTAEYGDLTATCAIELHVFIKNAAFVTLV